MSELTSDRSRRAFIRSAGGMLTAAGGTGVAAAQETGNETGGTPGGGADGGGGPPDYGDWFSDVGNYEGETVDRTGQGEVTVMVGTEGNGGNFAFSPPAVHVDAGTTLLFEWTGEGGAHNVVHQDGAFDSGEPVASAGVNFETTIDEDGIYRYICEPHVDLGMKGAIVVGADYPTVDTGGGGGGAGGPALPDVAKSLGVATTVVMAATLGLAYVFIRFGAVSRRETE